MSLPSLLLSHWQLSSPLLGEAAIVTALYLGAASRVRGRWSLGRTISFLGGIACVLTALQSGIDGYDDRLLSAHMAQHMLLLLIAPLLLLGGRPVILALRTLPPSGRRRLVRMLERSRRFTRPLVCLAAFWCVLLGTHLPAFYDATLRHAWLHDLEHVLYLASGLLMWWPLVGGDPVPAHRLGAIARLGYVIATMPPMALIGTYLDRHQPLLYSSYAAPAHALHISALADQAQAGALMWVGGNVLMVVAGLWVAMAELVAEERRMRVREGRLSGDVDRLPDRRAGQRQVDQAPAM